MRRSYLALCLLGCITMTGCLWQRRPPYANAPVLTHYKPTLSDSASILAERQVRRGPAKPPMPILSRDEETDHAPLPKIVEPAKAEERTPPPPPALPLSAAPKPSPVVRASAPASASSDVIPVNFVPAGVVVTPEPKPEPVKEGAPSPAQHRTVAGNYGHDNDYHWLQGIVERHYKGYVCVRYCDSSVENEFGGKVRLKEDDRLAAFQDGDVIGLTGDLQRNDSNPLFAVSEVWLVRKK